MDDFFDKIEAGVPATELTYRLVTENTLEWDRELQSWTIGTVHPIPEGKKLILLKGRGGVVLEEAIRDRELVQGRSGRYRYTLTFPPMETE